MTISMIFFIFTQVATGAQPMKFPLFKTVNFTKLECSPLVPKGFGKGVLLNMPEQIVWGDSLSICGYLKDDKDNYPGSSTNSTFGLIVKPQGKEKLREVYEDRTLGDPEIKMEGAMFKNFQQSGELYLNVDGQYKFRALPPGDYLVTLNFRDFNSSPRPLKVLPGGWRLNFSNLMANEICQGSILQDLSSYLDMNFKLELVELSEAGMKEYEKKMQLAWDSGFAKYKEKMGAVWPSEQTSVDESVSFYISQLVKEKCPQLKLRSGTVTYLLRGIVGSKK